METSTIIPPALPQPPKADWTLAISVLFALLIGLVGVGLYCWFGDSNQPHPNSETTVEAAPAPAPVVASAPAPVAAPVLPTARVLNNGTLYGMAKRLCGNGSRWSEIAELNLVDGQPLNPYKLLVNQEVKLPADCKSDSRFVWLSMIVAKPRSPQLITKAEPKTEIEAPKKAEAKVEVKAPTASEPEPAAVPEAPKAEEKDDDEIEFKPADVPSKGTFENIDEQVYGNKSHGQFRTAPSINSEEGMPECNAAGYLFFLGSSHSDEASDWEKDCREAAGPATKDQIAQAKKLIPAWQVVRDNTFARLFMGSEYHEAGQALSDLHRIRRIDSFDADCILSKYSFPASATELQWQAIDRFAHSKWGKVFTYGRWYKLADSEPIAAEVPTSPKKGKPRTGSE